MVIKRIILENFRQFVGRQEIVFESAEFPEKNVVVVYGQNGRGKTGLFRAVVFCLYGERKLSQDGDVPENEIRLANLTMLRDHPGTPVRTSVEMTFSHNGYTYDLLRSIRVMREGDKEYEQLDEIRLRVLEPDGNTRVVDVRDVPATVAKVLDPRVKDYFLFDGEKIERLTRSGLEQRREIRNGVRNLLGVDALETAIEASDCAVKSFNKALSSDPRTTENMARLLNELGGAEIESEAVSRRVDELADEERLSRDEMSRIDEKLNKYEEIRHLLNKRIDNEQQIKALTQKASISMSSMSELVCRTAACIVRPTLEAVFNYIDERKRKGDIPAEIRRDLILRILEEGHCICGNRITECTPEYYNIKRWLERSDDSSLQDAALDLWRYLSAALDRMENDRAEAQKRIIEHSEVVSEAQRLVDENAQLQSQIGGSDRQDISELDSMRSRIRAKQVQIEAEARNCSSRLVELEGRIARLKARIEEERRTANLNTVFSGRYGLAVAVRDALKEVHESYTGEIKAIIGEKATEVFRALIDAEGRTALKRIVVDDDYSLEVLDRWDRSFLANVSAGQRQIMSIAFISALASCASGASTINMPLFMDTPFGRLSSAHRNNLIRHVPTIASQWILLATDTEFTRAEATELMRTGQWGTFYQLVATPEGNTVIEGQRVEDALAYLR